jgi:hypothetical protein
MPTNKNFSESGPPASMCQPFSNVRCLALLLCLGAVNLPVRKESSVKWPDIEPVQRDYRFTSASQADVRIPILGVDSKPLYLFRCTPDLAFETGIIGALACYLITADGEDNGIDSVTLLTDDPLDNMVAHGRGQLSSYELEKACASYPEHGSTRTFRLRGMKLTIRVKDVEFAQSPNPHIPAQVIRGIHSLSLEVSVTSDATAISAVAEPVPYAPPRLKNSLDPWSDIPDCSTVIPAHVAGELTDAFIVQQGLSGPFPLVTPEEKSLQLEANKMQGHDFAFPGYPMPPKARMFSFPILGPEGNRVYDFACSGYTTGGRFQRYGIVCGLFLPEKEFNLLADGVDLYSRMNPSQILPDQLYAGCADYPGWGTRRVFRLRGMRLTMLLSNPVFVSGDFGDRALASLRLHVQIEPDSSVTSPVAKPPTVVYWGVAPGPHPCAEVPAAPAGGTP